MSQIFIAFLLYHFQKKMSRIENMKKEWSSIWKSTLFIDSSLFDFSCLGVKTFVASISHRESFAGESAV